MMRFFRIIRQRLVADIYKYIETPYHDFAILIGRKKADKLGNISRQFILRIDGRNKVNRIFFTNTVYLEPNLEKWRVAPDDLSCIFLPRFGNFVLIHTESLRKIELPEFAMTGEFISNVYYGNLLLILFTESVMLTQIHSFVSAVYNFDFKISDARLVNTNVIELHKVDGTVVLYDRKQLVFIQS